MFKDEIDLDLYAGENVIQFARKRGKAECNHRDVNIDYFENEITCNDCNAKLNPVAWLALHVERINQAGQRVNTMLAEYKAIEEKLEKKNTFMCKHCHEANTIDFHRLPSKAAVKRNLELLSNTFLGVVLEKK